VLGFTTEEVSQSPFVQSDVAVAVNAALEAAGIEIAFPQRIVHLEQNDNPSKHSSDPHRAGAGGNLPPRDGDLADTGNASLSSGDSLTN